MTARCLNLANAGRFVALVALVALLPACPQENAVVPALAGLSQTDAEAALATAGLSLGTVTTAYSDEVVVGLVLSQNPYAGLSVGKGSTVNLVVSGGIAPVSVPDVEGLMQATAEVLLTFCGLTSAVEEVFSETVEAGYVVSQDPVAGDFLAAGEAVTLQVSKGPDLVIVPDVAGKVLSQAQADLTASGFSHTVSLVFSDTVPNGYVVSQSPQKGVTALRGSAVALSVSKGPEFVQVPNIVGQTQSAAQAQLEVGLLELGAVAQEWSDTVAKGLIISQNPAAGATVTPGTAVSIEVSKGPEFVQVPNVVGQTQPAAQTQLENGLLVVGTVTEVWSDTVAVGLVVSQAPAAGATAAQGAAVALQISKGPEPVSVPTLSGMDVKEAQDALVAAELEPGSVTYATDESVAEDVVISQSPAAGQLVEPGTTVNLVISRGSSEMTLHMQAWQNTVAAAANDKAQKYGIYASRSLMVTHPEVYLAADALWMEDIVSVYGGWQAEYDHRDRENDSSYAVNVATPVFDAFANETKNDGSEFKWSNFRWSDHRANAAALQDFYAAGAPYRSWLDMRLPHMWNALKGTGYRTSPLTLGEALYFELRQTHDLVYLIITGEEEAYVATVSEATVTIYDPLSGGAVDGAALAGDAVLIMDNNSVWYPLMQRDDTASDAALGSVVDACAQQGAEPSLSYGEELLLEDLRAATELTSAMDQAWAELFAARFGDLDGWSPSVVRDFCMALLNDQYADYQTDQATPYEFVTMNLMVTDIANRLSPAAAVLASTARRASTTLGNGLQALANQYSQWFARQDSTAVTGAYCQFWLPSLDDKVISSVGQDLSEACNTASALYLANFNNSQVWVVHGWLGGSKGTPSRSGIYATGGKGVFASGLYTADLGPIYGSGTNVPANAVLYKLGTGFIYTGQSSAGVPFTNLGFDAAVDLLDTVCSLEPAARFATGNPYLVGAIGVNGLDDYLMAAEDNWVAYEFPPLAGQQAVVPLLVGLTLTNARVTLANSGLMVGEITYALDPIFSAGRVTSAQPNSFALVPYGTTVDLHVSSGIAPK